MAQREVPYKPVSLAERAVHFGLSTQVRDPQDRLLMLRLQSDLRMENRGLPRPRDRCEGPPGGGSAAYRTQQSPAHGYAVTDAPRVVA